MEKIKERIYNKNFPDSSLDIVLADIFPIVNNELLILTFESINSEWKQGVRLGCDGEMIINEQHIPSALLWYETTPKQVNIQCFTQNGFLVVYNIWDMGMGRNSLAYSSGMLIEELERGRRYSCNDIGFETQFDKLVFRIEKISCDKHEH